MSTTALQQVIDLPASIYDGHPHVSNTYRALAWRANDDAVAWPSHRTLAKETGQSVGTVKRHLRRLRDLGLIDIIDTHGSRHPWSPNRYQLTIPGQDNWAAGKTGQDTAPLPPTRPEPAATVLPSHPAVSVPPQPANASGNTTSNTVSPTPAAMFDKTPSAPTPVPHLSVEDEARLQACLPTQARLTQTEKQAVWEKLQAPLQVGWKPTEIRDVLTAAADRTGTVRMWGRWLPTVIERETSNLDGYRNPKPKEATLWDTLPEYTVLYGPLTGEARDAYHAGDLDRLKQLLPPERWEKAMQKKAALEAKDTQPDPLGTPQAPTSRSAGQPFTLPSPIRRVTGPGPAPDPSPGNRTCDGLDTVAPEHRSPIAAAINACETAAPGTGATIKTALTGLYQTVQAARPDQPPLPIVFAMLPTDMIPPGAQDALEEIAANPDLF